MEQCKPQNIQLANKAITATNGKIICVGCVETFYEHSHHTSWLAWRTIKYKSTRMPTERAILSWESPEVSPFHIKLALEIHLSTFPRNAASSGFQRLQSPTHKCYMRSEFRDNRVHERYVA